MFGVSTTATWPSAASAQPLQLGATNLMPGPNSTEVANHVLHRRARRTGLLVTGICFILPAMLFVTAFAWVSVHFGLFPD